MRSFKHAVHLGRSSPCVSLPMCIQNLLSWQLRRAAQFCVVSGDPVPKSSPGSHAELSSPLWDLFSSLCAGTSLSHAAQLHTAHTGTHSLRGLSHGGEILLSAALGKERSEAEAQIVFAAGGAVARGGTNHCTQRGNLTARRFREAVVFLRRVLV